MGFEREIREVVELLSKTGNPEKRRNILCSATLNDHVKSLAHFSLQDPIEIGLNKSASKHHLKLSSDPATDDTLTSLGEDDAEGHKIPATLKQHFVVVPVKRRLIILAAFIRWKIDKEKSFKGIVFVSN